MSIFQLNHNSSCMEEKKQGDLVYLGNNAGPKYEIIYIYCDKAWIRGLDYSHNEAIVPVSRLRLAERREVRLVA